MSIVIGIDYFSLSSGIVIYNEELDIIEVTTFKDPISFLPNQLQEQKLLFMIMNAIQRCIAVYTPLRNDCQNKTSKNLEKSI